MDSVSKIPAGTLCFHCLKLERTSATPWSAKGILKRNNKEEFIRATDNPVFLHDPFSSGPKATAWRGFSVFGLCKDSKEQHELQQG
jgi:hypothetical protein